MYVLYISFTSDAHRIKCRFRTVHKNIVVISPSYCRIRFLDNKRYNDDKK